MDEDRSLAESAPTTCWTRFLLVFLLSVATLMGGVLLFVIVVDPLDVFRTGLFPPSFQNVRATKTELLSTVMQQAPVEGLVFGSSRSMRIRPALLATEFGYSFFNFAVPGAYSEDYLALYRWARDHGDRPRILLIGLDVNALHDNEPLHIQLATMPELMRYVPNSSSLPVGPLQALWLQVRPYKLLLTESVVRAGLVSVGMARRADLPARRIENDGMTYGANPPRAGDMDRAALDTMWTDCLTLYRGIFGGMTGLSAVRKEYLETLIRESQRDGVEVRIWLTPVHPSAVTYLSRLTPYQARLQQTRAYLAQLRDRYQVTVFDLSVLEPYGAHPEDWYDCVHPDLMNSDIIARAIAP